LLPNRDGSPMKPPPYKSLTTDKVRFVGHPVAFVVAETQAAAKDAAEAVLVDIEALPAVTDLRAAAAPGAAAARRGARQCGARFSLWRCRQGRGGLR
jgi:carbon-monoxide dehydrogenase large subunit